LSPDPNLGRLAEAETSYREALRLRPNYPEAHNDLGNALRALGRVAEAERSYREARNHNTPGLKIISVMHCVPWGGWPRRRRAIERPCACGPIMPRLTATSGMHCTT
jgi:tetratricopeptide (TPR) repeat protein